MHLNAKRKEANNVLGIFGTSGELEQALLLPQCLFAAQELCVSRGRLAEKAYTHIHTHAAHRD